MKREVIDGLDLPGVRVHESTLATQIRLTPPPPQLKNLSVIIPVYCVSLLNRVCPLLNAAILL